MPQYPDVEVRLSGQDGNVFGIIGAVAGALRRTGRREAAREFTKAATECLSYQDVISLATETVNVV